MTARTQAVIIRSAWARASMNASRRQLSAATGPDGRIYAIGGNLKAAKLSGIDTERLTFLTFVNMGVLAALAGLAAAERERGSAGADSAGASQHGPGAQRRDPLRRRPAAA